MSEALLARGVNLVSGGTDNHLMLIDLRGTGVTGAMLQERLDDVNITANKNTIPFDPEKPTVTSGVRIGTPAATARGFKEEDFVEVANIIADCIFDYDNKKISFDIRDITTDALILWKINRSLTECHL